MNDLLHCELETCAATSEDGACERGHEPKLECPYLVSAEVVDPKDEGRPSDTIDLHRGRAVTAAQADARLRGERRRLVVPVGAVNAGKTTLVASLYHRCLRTIPEQFGFISSMTLVEFERIVHTLRLASGSEEGYTDRTRLRDHEALLHLRLDSGRPCESILFENTPGEAFARVLEGAGQPGSEFFMLDRAHVLLVCVDGERLDTRAELEAMYRNYRIVLRRIKQAEVLPSRARVVVALTKYDLVSASPKAGDGWTEFSEKITPDVLSLTEDEPAFIRTAARNRHTVESDGLNQLLQSLLSGRPPVSVRPSEAPQPLSELGRLSGGRS